MFREITPEDLKGNLKKFKIIDVREKDEYEVGHIPSAENIPLGKLISEFSKGNLHLSKETIVYADVGYRGHFAAQSLEFLSHKKEIKLGKILNLKGGFKAWKELH